MLGFSLTKIGAVLAGLGAAIIAIPPEIQGIPIGTSKGTPFTIGTIVTIVGTVMTIFGARNAIQKNTDATKGK